MELLGITMFSIAMLVIGLFRSIPLTTIQPIYNFPERLHDGFRLGYVAGRLGDVFDMLFPARHGNGSFVDQDAWPATLSIPDVALTRAVATSGPRFCPGATRLVRSDDVSIEVHATGTKCQAANIDYLSEYCQRRDRHILWNDLLSEPCRDTTTSAYIHESVKNSSILTAVLVALVVLAAIMATAARIQRQCTAAIEDEIQTIISKIQVRNTTILQLLDRITTLTEQIVHEVLANSPKGENNGGLPTALSSIVETTNATKKFTGSQGRLSSEKYLADVENAHGSVPCAEEIAATSEEFLPEIQRSGNRMLSSLARLEAYSTTYPALANSTTRSAETFDHVPYKEDYSPSRELTAETNTDCKEIDEISTSAERVNDTGDEEESVTNPSSASRSPESETRTGLPTRNPTPDKSACDKALTQKIHEVLGRLPLPPSNTARTRGAPNPPTPLPTNGEIEEGRRIWREYHQSSLRNRDSQDE